MRYLILLLILLTGCVKSVDYNTRACIRHPELCKEVVRQLAQSHNYRRFIDMEGIE